MPRPEWSNIVFPDIQYLQDYSADEATNPFGTNVIVHHWGTEEDDTVSDEPETSATTTIDQTSFARLHDELSRRQIDEHFNSMRRRGYDIFRSRPRIDSVEDEGWYGPQEGD